ncbi:VOC family protein [Gordonia polyisoprenivorans]|uniref:VOC family protein n=1 Tax=Gordonia polyisoprenivorans TaxID=84595 RepID=UPI001AD699D0|nr:VOC family protein [Gordonia polyisoprenivorans]QTI68082.1 VOC family protein [Gordonia polyisoprenivorans]
MEVLSSRVLLRSRDPESLQHFYRHQLRLAVAREYPGGVVFYAGNGLIEVPGHMSSDLDTTIEPSGALWLQVRDVSAVERELRSAHATIEREPLTEPWGLIEMHVRDTDGRLLIIVEVPPTHPLRLDNR